MNKSNNAITEESRSDFWSMIIEEEYGLDLEATQPQTQPQNCLKDLEPGIIGCLIPATDSGHYFELVKDKQDNMWRIGRHITNDLSIEGHSLSEFHCTLVWNGKSGKHCEVRLTDTSSHGTWVNNIFLTHGHTAILRSGSSIALGGTREQPSDLRFIYRDIEGLCEDRVHKVWEKYDIGDEIGSGSFARVYKCIERATGLEYAVKVVERENFFLSSVKADAIEREIRILKHLSTVRHRYVVSFLEHFEEEEAVYLILELVRGGDLSTYLRNHGIMSEREVQRMAVQICDAIAYIHSEGITHRDLKLDNIMLTLSDPPNCKVADFGLAKLVEDGTFLKTACGTPAYLAPEIRHGLGSSHGQGYDNQVDSWSLGVIFHCMLTNRVPFSANSADKVDWSILREIHLSDEGHDFLSKLLTADPRAREEVTFLRQHPWLSNAFDLRPQMKCARPSTKVQRKRNLKKKQKQKVENSIGLRRSARIAARQRGT